MSETLHDYLPTLLIGVMGLVVIIVAVTAMVLHHQHEKRAGHNDADYHCKFYWGDRRESIGARCLICNPSGQDVLRG